ncbi:coagulation factor VII [Centroberyx gerrardi]|uniref:coagulation factor VII n=1 Tax=Centroberyx gerrardi TaxID=166262 RepID=UPI003AADD19A
MWLRVFCLVFSVCGCQPASVFVGRQRAHGLLLVRTRRFNSGWLEELQRGDLRRECLEEKCSYEEAREVFEHTETTDEFWKTYNVPDSCESNPCQNGGSCSSQDSSYTCFCSPDFSGRDCELEYQAVPDSCLLDNGGCEHFCQEEGGRRRNCSCADGYFLDADGLSCPAQEPIACGMVPVLQGADKSEQLDPRSRIVGGTECPKGHCPWQVLLVYKGKGFCGGVIYKPTWILTASHCLEDTREVQLLQVVAGEHNTEVDEGTEQLIQVAQIFSHEGYVSRTADNDIALLRLASPIVFTPYAVPACLPTRPLAERDLWAVSMHTVSGWGRRSENGPTSHLLRRLEVPRIRTQQCVEESGVQLTENMFCAGYIEGRQDSCKGDSGGPLVTRYKKTVFLLGIVSWGKGCAQPGNYGIYTRVSNYLEWIHNRTATPDQPTNHTEALAHNLTT